MAVAYEFAKVLKAAGKNPTRASVMAQTQKLNDPSNPFLLPGLTIKTSATERFPIEQARYSAGRRELEELRRALGLSELDKVSAWMRCSRRSTTCSRRRARRRRGGVSSPTRRRSSSR